MSVLAEAKDYELRICEAHIEVLEAALKPLIAKQNVDYLLRNRELTVLLDKSGGYSVVSTVPEWSPFYLKVSIEDLDE